MFEALFLVLQLISLPSGYNCNAYQYEPAMNQLNYPCAIPSDLTGLRLHITNYQPYDLVVNSDGSLFYDFHTTTNYQCREPCNQTANGTLITNPLEQNIAACPLSWVNNRVVIIINDIEWHCEDTFGLIGRQNGLIWHEGLSEWVICIDLLTHIPTYFQADEWEIITK